MSGEQNMQQASDGEICVGRVLLGQRWGTGRLFCHDSGSLVQTLGQRLEMLLASLQKSLGHS